MLDPLTVKKIIEKEDLKKSEEDDKNDREGNR